MRVGVYVSFFRGINVGGRHLVKMDALRKLHQSLGFEDVASHLQSGSVIFRAASADAARIEKAFEKEFGFRSAVILRSAKQLEAAARKCPFRPEDGRKPNWIAIVFFADKPDSAAAQALRAYQGPEEVQISGREIYVYYAAGMRRSKLPLKGSGTVRNWNTVNRLLAMTASL